MYSLPPEYVSRLEPAYFDDVLSDSTEWQADVYRLAHHLAFESDVENLVDLGCGNGKKLLPYAESMQIIGLDYGKNIDFCQDNNSPGTWIRLNLNQIVVPVSYFTDSVVICADIIEHLPQPEALIQSIQNACSVAKYVLISTPDRERVYKGEHNGPPGNPYHVREWSNAELVHWLRSEDIPVQWHGWTVSNDNRRDQVWTSLVVASKTELVLNLPDVFEPAPIVWDGLGLKYG